MRRAAASATRSRRTKKGAPNAGDKAGNRGISFQVKAQATCPEFSSCALFLEGVLGRNSSTPDMLLLQTTLSTPVPNLRGVMDPWENRASCPGKNTNRPSLQICVLSCLAFKDGGQGHSGYQTRMPGAGLKGSSKSGRSCEDFKSGRHQKRF